MRVLLANKFFYPRGGDCVVTMNTARLLRAAGIDVGVLTMDYGLNVPYDGPSWSASEVDPLSGGFGSRLRAAERMMGTGDIVATVRRALDEFAPDVVHLHNIHTHLSPVVAREAHRRGSRVVWTLHDYKLVCPAYTCLRDGVPCRQCVAGGKAGVVRHRCMKGSLAASAAAWAESRRWSRTTLERWVDAYVCPSEFMAGIMTEAGFDSRKLHVLHNFADAPAIDSRQPREGYCYVGRLSPEKGVATLVDAARRLPYPLTIAGTGPSEQTLRQMAADCPHITFAGQLCADEVARLLARTRALVCPSRWYENNPLSVIEALQQGTPVVATRIGGLPELVDDSNGILVDLPAAGDGTNRADNDSGTVLATAIERAMATTWRHNDIADVARRDFAPSRHIERLLGIYCPPTA